MEKREIKFRAWIEKDKVMFYQSAQYLQSFLRRANLMFNPEQSGHDSYGQPTLMQFTGLKDKNGQEIYEGDITKNPKGEIGTVVFNDGCFRLLIHKSETSAHYITLNQGFCDNKEVIGNIYQNANLLSDGK